MPGNEILGVILNILKKGTGGTETEKELSGVEKAAKAAGSSLSSFDTSAKATWSTLTSGQRAAQMTASEMGDLAVRLGVATDAEVQTTIKMNALTAAWEKGEISSEQLADGIDELGNQADDVSGDMDGLSSVIDVAMVAAVAKGALELGKMTFELAQVGAQSLRTKSAFEAISGSTQQASANLEAMERATRGALTEQQAMESANQLMSMGLANNADELENVTEMAVRLGAAMGRTASESISEFSLLLSNQSIPRLDTFGISAGKVRARILELQAATPGLSREMAFMTAVNEQGATSLERLGPALDDDALAFERVAATVDNLTTAFAEELSPVVADVLETGMLLLTWNEQLAEAQQDQAEATLMTATSYEEYVAELTRAAGVAGMMVNEQGDLVRIQDEFVSGGGLAVNITEELVQANFALSKAVFEVARTTDTATVGMANASDVMRGNTEVALQAAAASDEFAKSQAQSAQDSASLATSLKDATSGQIASRLVGMLDPKKMGAEAYGAAVGEIGTRFGIMDIQSIALAENMGLLAEAIEEGIIPAENADDALIALIDDARDGQVDIEGLTDEFSELSGWALSAGAGMRDAMGGMQGIARHQGEAVEGIASVGESAATATGQVGGFAGQLGTTEEKLEALVAGSPWLISVEASSGPQPDIPDIPTTFAGGGTTRTDNRRFSSDVQIVNNIFGADTARAIIEEQRHLLDARISSGF